MTEAQQRVLSDWRTNEARRVAEGFQPNPITTDDAPSYAPEGSILVRFSRIAYVLEPSGKRWRLDA